MSALMHTLSLLIAIIAAYIWLHIPFLAPYSLQVFAGSVIVYLLIKRIKKTQFWHLAPGNMSIELALLTFAILLVVGYTGDTRSLYFALGYIHLFFLVFSAEATTAIIATAVIVLYYYALAPDPTLQDYANLVTLPLMMFFFIFAKAQYQQVTQKREQVAQEEQVLADTVFNTQQLHSFLVDFLKPKLEYLTTLLSHPAQNKQTIQGQLTLLQVEIEKMVSRSEKSIQVNQELTVEIEVESEVESETEKEIKPTETVALDQPPANQAADQGPA